MPRRGLCPAYQQFKVVNGVEVCGCNCSECKVEQEFQGYSCACTYTVGTCKCKNLVSETGMLCEHCTSGNWDRCDCDCDKCKHEPNSGDSSSHSSNSPGLGDREGLCQCSIGHGSHGCRNITTHTPMNCVMTARCRLEMAKVTWAVYVTVISASPHCHTKASGPQEGLQRRGTYTTTQSQRAAQATKQTPLSGTPKMISATVVRARMSANTV